MHNANYFHDIDPKGAQDSIANKADVNAKD